VQTLADRLSKALKRYLQMKDLGLPVGFPRFKTPNRWQSIQLRQYAAHRDVWLDESGKHLHVPAKLGRLLKINLHRPLEGTPVTAHLVLRADGHGYALIVCETEPQDEQRIVHPERTACVHPAIGLDVGLKVFLADSEGGMVENPRHSRRGQKRLAHGQRTVCRRTKGSRRRRKATREVACQHLTVSRQRRDFHFKTAKQYAERYSRICVEDVHIWGMVQNHSLAKRIHDASGSAFLNILTDKAERAGHVVSRGGASPRALHDAEVQWLRRVRSEKPERAHAYLSLLWAGRRSRRECGQAHGTGGGTAFVDGSRWAAG
jgi:putative transposase